MIDAGTAASSAPAGSAAALLDGFHPAILTSLAIAVVGIAITVVPLITGRRAPAPTRTSPPSRVTRADSSGGAASPAVPPGP